MKEIWSSISGYKHYQISNFGRVKSLPRFTKNGRCLTEKILAASNNGEYKKIYLCENNTKSRFYIHRLVACAFIPNPENKPEINHKNGIKTDNRVENLEWVSKSENLQHAHKIGIVPKFKRTARKIPVICIETGKKYKCCLDAERQTGICVVSIRNNIKGKYKSAGGFHWRAITKE